jgi:hypothetical protein
MIYELALLKALLDKSNYLQYRNYLSKDDFPKEIVPILFAIDEHYKTNTESPSVEDVANLTFGSGIPQEAIPYVGKVLEGLKSDAGKDSVGVLLERVKNKAICQRLASAAINIVEGTGNINSVMEIVEKLKAPVSTKVEYVTDNLDDILTDTVRKPGLRWRLNCLNKSLGSLRQGDFGVIFARPETGKTTFLSSEATHMSTQLQDNDGPILWFNNEEQGKKVKLRHYQAALGAKLSHIIREPERAKEVYAQLTKNKIKLIDKAVITRGLVESICAAEKPSLVILDQIDKIKGFNADRDDLVMGAIYIWGRELAKTYCPVIGVCQADGTAEGERWLYMNHVANAKTAKQAEADFIIGIGKSHEAGYDYVRFINIAKNKLIGDPDTDPSMKHAKLEVLIKPEISRYEDIQ